MGQTLERRCAQPTGGDLEPRNLIRALRKPRIVWDCKEVILLKVLHITTDFFPGTGGLERFVQDLAVHSRTAGIDSAVLCLDRIAGDSRPLPQNDLVDGIPVQRIKFVDLKYYKPVLLPLNVLKTADILHMHGIGSLLDFVAATKWIHHKPIVLSTHGGIFHNSALSTVKNAYFSVVRRLVLPRVDRIIACGESDRRLFADHHVSETTTIDNGIDLSDFNGLDSSVERVSRRMLFVGRIAPNKCINHLIQTLAAMRQRGAQATLRVIGPDRYQLNAGLKQLAIDLGVGDAVEIVGEVPLAELPGEYARADLFVSASRHEGFGISAVEAMAGGAVPLLNNIPAFDYLLRSVQKAGMLCNFSDPDAAADAAIQLFSADRQAFRDAARARAAEFSWQCLIPRWKEVYDSVSPHRSLAV